MVRQRRPLTAAFVAAVKHSGEKPFAERHCDAGRLGLTLNVRPTGTKSWVQTIVIRGKRRAMGLGPYPQVGLAAARKRAFQNSQIAREGGDPRRPKAHPPRFREAAAQLIDVQASSWTNPKSRAQWGASLAAYVFPTLGDLRVDRIEPADVLAVLTPIWGTKRETAQRVRQRIAAVMRWTIANGHRPDNPAGDAVLQALPRRRPPVKHHRALPYADVPDAVRRIRGTRAWTGTKLAFEFLVLTAARSGEVRGATWDEIDLDAAMWTVPAHRMKAAVEHRVPLAPRCVDLLGEARAITEPHLTAAHRGCPLVFPSMRGRMLSDNTLSKLLREHAIAGVPHGFRSSFRDWAAENTTAPHAVMEAALAHTIPRAVEAAYARSDLLDKRRELMARWAVFVGQDRDATAK